MSSLYSWLQSAVHYTGPWVAYVVLLIAIATGLFLNILGLPGLWLIVFAAILYGWGFGFAYIGWWTIGVLVVLGLLAELVEFFAGAAGSKSAGGSKRGMAGAIVGGLVGGVAGTAFIPIPILGTIVGSVVGCFLGAYGVEWAIGKSHGDAAKISYGAAKGRVLGLVAKTIFGVAMAMVTAIVAIPFNWWSQPVSASIPSSAPTTNPTTASSLTESSR